MNFVHLWTDGSVSPKNPGKRGGWGGIIIHPNSGKIKIVSGVELTPVGKGYTNNQMEVLAVTESLKILKTKCSVKLFTDSQYVNTGIMKYSSRSKIHSTNKKYWKDFVVAFNGHEVFSNHVYGHEGTTENELAHKLAYYAAKHQTLFDHTFDSLEEAYDFTVSTLRDKKRALGKQNSGSGA